MAITVLPGARVELRGRWNSAGPVPLASADNDGRLSLVDHYRQAATLIAPLHRHTRGLTSVLDGRLGRFPTSTT